MGNSFVSMPTTSGAVVLAILMTTCIPAQVRGQSQLPTGIGPSAGKERLSDFHLHLRHANTGELAGSTVCNEAGQYSFSAVQPGQYVVEFVGATGKVVGLSAAIDLEPGATVTVTIGAVTAGAMAATTGDGLDRLGAGPLASVAVVGANSAAAVTSVLATRTGKIVVCHKVSVQLSQTLEINDSARDSHLGHGDTLGRCSQGVSR